METLSQLEARYEELSADHSGALFELGRLESITSQLQEENVRGHQKKQQSRDLVKLRIKQMRLQETVQELEHNLSNVQEHIQSHKSRSGRQQLITELARLGQYIVTQQRAYLQTRRQEPDDKTGLAERFQQLGALRHDFVTRVTELAPGMTQLLSTTSYQNPDEARQLHIELESLRHELEQRGVNLRAVMTVLDANEAATMWDVVPANAKRPV